MDIHKISPIATTIGTAFILAVLIFPYKAKAIGVGEAVLHSERSAPLHIRIALIPEQNEHVENSCLSLAEPDPLQQDTGLFLTEANLSVISEENQQYVDIRSQQPSSYIYTKLRLKIKCPGVLGLIKTITIPMPQPVSNTHGHPLLNFQLTGKNTTEGLALLLEQQKQQVASLEDMQQKIKLLEDELKGIKLQLMQARTKPPNTAGNTQENGFNPIAAINRWGKQEGILVAIVAIALTSLALWLGLRYFTRKNLPAKNISEQLPSPARIATDKTSALPLANTQLSQASIAVTATTPPLSFSLERINEETTYDNSMLEEASLYAANGRMEKAVEILKEVIGRAPSKEDAWKLLLSIYSALGDPTKFENTARNFLKYHKGSPSWSGIQVLGRTLARDNPLYTSNDSHISASPLLPNTFTHRPIGDILVEMGALSKQEVLKYLDEFDPRQHCRFGGYLVARKAITLDQLDLALLRQQNTGNVEPKQTGLPSLQDVEKLLDEFDPKQHGSVIKFLASRDVALPEQLSQYLLQQKSASQQQKNLGTVI